MPLAETLQSQKMDEQLYTRAQLLADCYVGQPKEKQAEQHYRFWSQFLNPANIRVVRQGIGLERIQKSEHPHFSDIPIQEWDRLHLPLRQVVSRRTINRVCEKPEDAPFYWTLSDSVCLAKTAAAVLAGRIEAPSWWEG